MALLLGNTAFHHKGKIELTNNLNAESWVRKQRINTMLIGTFQLSYNGLHDLDILGDLSLFAEQKPKTISSADPRTTRSIGWDSFLSFIGFSLMP